MSEDWDSKTVIGFKRQTAKVTKKDSELNGEHLLVHFAFLLISLALLCQLYARRTGAVVATDKKIASGSNKAHVGTDHQRIAKLDRENEVAPPTKVAPSVGRAMQTARLEKQLTQKDLAARINEKPSVLQDYESGKAIPNPQILGKLERALGVKLRGANIGQKLEGPKKT
ncbi:hypothetical protein MD484_g3591, partial [Candolleomyces efflorescens]